MKNLSNNKGFAIVMAMGIVLVMSLTAIYILEFMVPFSKNVNGIENASNAYYQAYGQVETAIFSQKNKDIWLDKDPTTISTSKGGAYEIKATSLNLPPAGKGNSEYNQNFNQIGPNNPVQLRLPSGDNKINNLFNNITFTFQTPKLDGTTNTSTIDDIIHWSLSCQKSNNTNITLNANSDNLLSTPTSTQTISSKTGVTLQRDANGTYETKTLLDFYSTCSDNIILKLSIIKELKAYETKFPYLEYKITSTDNKIPTQMRRVIATGKSYGYQKKLEVNIPQETLNQAFDFTVIQ